MMNPGYISLWVILIIIVLLITGWRPFLAPGISKRAILMLAILLALLVPLKIWWQPLPEFIHAELHISVVLLILVGLMAYIGKEEWGSKVYILLCAIMIAALWGVVRKVYSFDPVLYWLNPKWDAPLIGGMLCAAFTSSFKHQFGIIITGAVLGEWLYAVVLPGNVMVRIGDLTWWDSFLLAVAAARVFSFILIICRRGLSKLEVVFWHIKRGRSS